MAGTSGFSGEFEGVEVSDSFCAMGGSEWKCLMASASEGDGASMALSFASAREESIVGIGESREGSSIFVSVEEQIEKSKSHWSTLADQSGAIGEGEEVAEVSNVEEFTALQLNPLLGAFFQTFDYELPNGRYGSMGELVVGKKFAEGAQAELYKVKVNWWKAEYNERDVAGGYEWVLKVFKKGTYLKHLKSQLPHELLQFRAEVRKYSSSPTPKLLPRLSCEVRRGILLEDGRFAFLMLKEDMDLRSLIERNLTLWSGVNNGPFSNYDVEFMMYRIALGVRWLHDHNIIHRDLKASNVLVRELKGFRIRWLCYVADYECSIGVVGTGFFRAPEILQACEEGKVSQKPEVFSRAADMYSYGMTCYEILTGKLPFEDHPLSLKLLINLVVKQHLRPEIPEYVEDWKKTLLQRCWHFDPLARPLMDEILDLLTSHSPSLKVYDAYLKNKYGENFRSQPYIEIPK